MLGVKPCKLELKSRVNCCPGGGDGDQRDITRPLTTASSPTNQCLSRMGIGEGVAAMLGSCVSPHHPVPGRPLKQRSVKRVIAIKSSGTCCDWSLQ